MTFCLLPTKPMGLSSVTCSKSSELLTYLLVGRVQNLCCFTHCIYRNEIWVWDLLWKCFSSGAQLLSLLCVFIANRQVYLTTLLQQRFLEKSSWATQIQKTTAPGESSGKQYWGKEYELLTNWLFLEKDQHKCNRLFKKSDSKFRFGVTEAQNLNRIKWSARNVSVHRRGLTKSGFLTLYFDLYGV